MNARRSEGTRRPVGRRPGDPEDTRRGILAAAKRAFSANGYERATIRSIADDAGVDPGLVIHHFRNKQDLFAAAHELPLNPGEIFDAIATTPPDQRGEALTRAYLEVLAAPGSPVFSLLRAAATNQAAATMMRDFITDGVLDRASELIPGPDAAFRVTLVFSHLIGLAMAREIIGVPPLASAGLEEVIAAVAPTIQHYLDG